MNRQRERLIQIIDQWIREKKYGQIQINFAGGAIPKVKKLEDEELGKQGPEAA